MDLTPHNENKLDFLGYSLLNFNEAWHCQSVCANKAQECREDLEVYEHLRGKKSAYENAILNLSSKKDLFDLLAKTYSQGVMDASKGKVKTERSFINWLKKIL